MAEGEDGAGPPSPFSLEPTSFAITLRLDQEQTLPLTLTNTSGSYAAFKVKTTNPDRYLVRPTQDIVKPGESKVCKIIFAKISELPDPSNAKAFRDKFLVQSLPLEDIPPTAEDLARLWKERERVHNARKGRFAYSEQILRCRLSLPASVHTEAAVDRVQGSEPALQLPSVPDARGKADARTLPPAAPPSLPLPVPQTDAATYPATTPPLHPTAASVPVPTPTPRQDGHQEARSAEAKADDTEKQQEVEEMMTYLVKLTSENAKLKQEVQALSQRHNQLLITLEASQKGNAELQAQLAEAGTQQALLTLPALATSGAGGSAGGLRRRVETKPNSPTDVAVGDPFPASNNVQWWHLAAIAMLFFLIGKLF